MPVAVLLLCVLALLAIGVASLCVSSKRLATSMVYGLSAVVCSALCATALLALNNGPFPVLHLPLGLPWIGANFQIDPLSALFLVIVNLGGAAASLYALGYGRHEKQPMRVLPFFPAFLAAMNLVLLAADAFAFLISWEFMSLVSWALVLAHHRSEDNLRAGYVYILMASFGTFALLLAFGLLAGPDGGYAFTTIRSHHPDVFHASLVLLLALLGAGSKAGLLPLHVWLPLAHPAAPSHVSALMSGVMTKVAVYAFIRIIFDLAGPPQWGHVVLTQLSMAARGLSPVPVGW